MKNTHANTTDNINVALADSEATVATDNVESVIGSSNCIATSGETEINLLCNKKVVGEGSGKLAGLRSILRNWIRPVISSVKNLGDIIRFRIFKGDDVFLKPRRRNISENISEDFRPEVYVEAQNQNSESIKEGESISIQSDDWHARSEKLRNHEKLPPAPIPPVLAALLRPYQRIGVAWLWLLREYGLGGILADEMGLGKTVQALALLAAAKRVGGSRLHTAGNPVVSHVATDGATPAVASAGAVAPAPSLIVCPAMLIENWRREAARFTPELRVFVNHGDNRLPDATALVAYDLVITSYSTLVRDSALFSTIEFDILIADEAQHLKNRETHNACILRAMHARSRFMCSGTPLENSVDDIRSLFEILMPGYLAPVPSGARKHKHKLRDEQLNVKIAPYILRRTKQSVAPDIPEKFEHLVSCGLNPSQAAIYQDVLKHSRRKIRNLEARGASEGKIRRAAYTQLLRLRQVCCDPRLLYDTEFGSLIPYPCPASAKLGVFNRILIESLDAGHRVLVFSQFTKFLALIREELDSRHIPYAYLDGSMSLHARQAEVDRFNNPPADGSFPTSVFLISLKAGGTGLNLTAADRVIHLDLWWNPAVEAQATDRAHRIGQTRVVHSHKLFCRNTVEEKVLQLQNNKRALLAGVFEASDAFSSKLSLADIKELFN